MSNQTLRVLLVGNKDGGKQFFQNLINKNEKNPHLEIYASEDLDEYESFVNLGVQLSARSYHRILLVIKYQNDFNKMRSNLAGLLLPLHELIECITVVITYQKKGLVFGEEIDSQIIKDLIEICRISAPLFCDTNQPLPVQMLCSHLNKMKPREFSAQGTKYQLSPLPLDPLNIKPLRDCESFNSSLGIMLGSPASGRTTLLLKLTDNNNAQLQAGGSKLGSCSYRGKQFGIIDTASFDSEEKRNLIEINSALTKYTYNRIFLVVKFQRNDDMKNCMKPVLLALKRYIKQISVIITHWDLGESIVEDEQSVKKGVLGFYGLVDCFFVGKNTDINSLKGYLQNVLEQNQPFKVDTTDTVLKPSGLSEKQFQDLESLHTEVARVQSEFLQRQQIMKNLDDQSRMTQQRSQGTQVIGIKSNMEQPVRHDETIDDQQKQENMKNLDDQTRMIQQRSQGTQVIGIKSNREQPVRHDETIDDPQNTNIDDQQNEENNNQGNINYTTTKHAQPKRCK